MGNGRDGWEGLSLICDDCALDLSHGRHLVSSEFDFNHSAYSCLFLISVAISLSKRCFKDLFRQPSHSQLHSRMRGLMYLVMHTGIYETVTRNNCTANFSITFDLNSACTFSQIDN